MNECAHHQNPGLGRALSWVRASNEAQGYGLGTLAAVLRCDQQERLYGLTAGHVLGEDDRARTQDACQLRTMTGRVVTGRLSNWFPWFGAEVPSNPVDAGLVEVEAAALESLVHEFAWPLGWADARPGEPLRVLTRQHRLAAVMRESGRSVAMEVGRRKLRYEILGASLIEVDAPIEPGDSGAAVWNLRDELVGVLAGTAPLGSAGNAVMTPVRPILDWACATLVLRHEALRPEDRGAPRPRTAAEPASASAPLAAARANDDEHALAVDTLARTMWGEARGEPQQRLAMEAVGHVVLNRVMGARWWGSTVVEVCRKRAQFSCWNPGDPNLQPMMQVTPADAAFALACDIATALLQRPADDPERLRNEPTRGATHYFARSMARWPDWAVGRPVVATLGNHLFFKDVG